MEARMPAILKPSILPRSNCLLRSLAASVMPSSKECGAMSFISTGTPLRAD
ncbi:Uncharacterised protein [Vibrio cholerae]|nr:Uncharacterised protein [Vibrio cholerae]CSI11808.1 Uncharacterised protein [Vibrio cholerae]